MFSKNIYLLRNRIERFFYVNFARKIFFKVDPEEIHDRMTSIGSFLGKSYFLRKLTSLLFNYKSPALKQKILGIEFENPVGLAAGFDKNAQLTEILPSVGFGFIEVGSITGEQCFGNEKPRLWRLPKSKGLVVNYGLKNDGCEEISNRLKLKKFNIPVGISIAKTNSKDTVNKEKRISDYVKAYRAMKDIGSYITVNISCPNTFGGCPFTDPAYLEDLLSSIEEAGINSPIFIKFPANIKESDIDDIVNVANKYNVSGFVCTNLNKDRQNKGLVDENIPEKGGISGRVLNDESNRIIRYIYQLTGGSKIIIGCGGIFSAQDAYEKIKSGASLVQLITGMIYEGPQLISSINMELVRMIEADGFKSVSEAVGSKHKK